MTFSISWTEVIDNFTSVKKATQKAALSPLPLTTPSPSLSVPSTPVPSSEEVKHVSIPKVKTVSRKRVYCSREEKEAKAANHNKQMRVKEEDAQYLKWNTENLRIMKERLEAIKQRMKEIKEKKNKKEKKKKKV